MIMLVCVSCKTTQKERMPVVSQATQETVALYNRLFDLMEKGFMVGHQDYPLYGHGWYGDEGSSDV